MLTQHCAPIKLSEPVVSCFGHLAPRPDAILDGGGQFDLDSGLIETTLDGPAEPLSLGFCY